MMEHWMRLHSLQARAKVQGMSDGEFAALAAEVNDRVGGSITERLDTNAQRLHTVFPISAK